MADQEELSSLERMRRRLYSAKESVTFKEPQLSERPVERPRGWEHLEAIREEAKRMSAPARFFVIALIFFAVTLGGAIFYLLYGGQSVSTSNVSITVQGPTTIASGDTVPLLISIENRNPVPIRATSLSITFPEGTKSVADPSQPLTLYTQDLGDILAGAKIQIAVKGVLFGSEGQAVNLPIELTYHTDASNSVFVKDKQYQFTITTSPISLTVSSLSQVSAGQPVTVDIDVKSNATTPLQNIAVEADYPFGFTPSSVNPPPAHDSLFVLGTMNPGDEKHISITGTLTGQQNDERVFTFKAGALSAPDAPTLTSPFTTKEADITLTAPFLATTLSVNHDTSDSPIIDPGTPAQVTVSWSNTLSTPIENAAIRVRLAGSALDPSSVSVGNGFYSSSDNTVLFDASTNPGLAHLAPGDTGQGFFTFSTVRGAALAALRNPSITLTASASGQRIGETNVPQTITSSVTKTVKVATSLGFTSRVVYTSGPFKNTGPWPPEPNTETTYTVILALTNTGNSVAGARVTAALPSYVRYTGATNPSDGSITYNETTHTVTWNAGDVASGTSVPKTAAFQIAFTPSISQEGTSPILLFAQQLTGVDRFTQAPVSASQPQLDTRTTTDPAYSVGDGSVK